jgi:DNA-binding NarL/FixJ family response regulator
MQHALTTGDLSVMTAEEFDVLDVAPDVPMVLLSRALVALLFGRTEEAAARHAELSIRLKDPDFARSPGVARTMVFLVEEFGDRDTAARLAELIAATPFAVGGSGIYCCGSSASDLGRLAVVLGRLDEAVEHFEEALAIDARVGARPAAALDRVHLARALVARGRPGDPANALALAREAATDARKLGMPGPLRDADVLVGRATAATRAADPLTSREREIADLVSAGLTNREIAGRLFLSARTVETHVRNILNKLGLPNRTQIATTMVSESWRSAQSRESTAR